MLIKGTAAGGPEARRHIAVALCIVAGIAVTHVAATQAAQQCVLNGVPPFFSMWFSTGWNVLLALPLLRLGTAGTSVSRLVWQVLPFYALWAGANTMYVAALGSLTSSLTTALFSVTPALVVLLAVPLLRRRLTLFSVLACLLAAAGVALVAQPWSEASSGESVISLRGLAAVLGAAACAALYKVLFKRLFGDPPARSVLLVLALLGCWSLTIGTAILGGVTAAAQGGVPAAVAALPALPWGFLCLKALFDLAFNFLIALGISLTHPLFISIGTILGTPLNVLVEWLLRGTAPSPVEAGGIATILLAFVLLLAEEQATHAAQAAQAAQALAQLEAAQQAHAADADPAADAAVDPAVIGGGSGCSALDQAAAAAGMEVVRTRGWARLDEVSADAVSGHQPTAEPGRTLGGHVP